MSAEKLALSFEVRFPDFQPGDADRLDELADAIGFNPDLKAWLEDFTVRVYRMMLTWQMRWP